MTDQDRYLETEAKLLVDDLARVESRLAVMRASLTRPRILERNIRYDDAGRGLIAAGVVLRLRQDDRAWLTYKSRPVQPAVAGIQTRFEAEVEVSDYSTMDLILQKLGYVPAMIYEKYRTTYEIHEVEVALDEMPYGSFVELEGPPEQIEAAIAALRLTNCTRFEDSYARLFDHVRANLGLTFTDLTFANFAGVRVPPEAFYPPRS